MSESQKIIQVRSARQVPVRVKLLDDDVFNHSVDKRALGWILFDKVCEHLNILEKDYFGLTYIDPAGEKYWLNNEKKIAKQMKGQNWDFSFEVKFYPADPAQLAEDLTRYQLCLQIRRDIVNEKLPCSFVTYTLLGSYTAQSELGDYDTEEFGTGYKYLKDMQFAPHQDKELLIKIAELHRQHKGQTPEESELHFLENAKKLSLYGVELHPAKDADGKDIQLGVCASGLIVYKDKQQINRFVWPKVLKISYRRQKYYIKIRPGEFEEFASLVGFKLQSVKYAKRLWKISVEHHTFFRFREPDPPKSASLMPRFGSRFRYSGRTQFQTRQLVAEEGRDAPFFDRVLSKRGTFAGRTQAMKKRDEDRQLRRDEVRRQPPPPLPQTKVPLRDSPQPSPRHDRPEPKHDRPEPKHAPPIAPKPAIKPKPYPRGSRESLDRLDREPAGSLNDSFEDIPDRKSRMEKMHAVPTPLAAVMQKSMEKKAEDDRRSIDHDRRSVDHDRRSVDHDRHSVDRHSMDRYSDDRPEDREVRRYSQINDTNPVIRDRTKSALRGRSKSQIPTVPLEQAEVFHVTNTSNIDHDKYLFSYPSSSIDSILSHADYSIDDQYSGNTGSIWHASEQDLSGQQFGRRKRQTIEHSRSIGNLPGKKSQYKIQTSPDHNEGHYDVIDDYVGVELDPFRDKPKVAEGHYSEITPVAQTDPLKKIVGRRSQKLKQNQSSQNTPATNVQSVGLSKPITSPTSPLLSKSEIPEKTSSFKRKLSKFFRDKKRSKSVSSVEQSEEQNPRSIASSTSEVELGQSTISKQSTLSIPSLSQTPTYATINKPKCSKSDNRHINETKDDDKISQSCDKSLSDSVSSVGQIHDPPLDKPKQEPLYEKIPDLKEEFKMYLLNPDSIKSKPSNKTIDGDSLSIKSGKSQSSSFEVAKHIGSDFNVRSQPKGENTSIIRKPKHEIGSDSFRQAETVIDKGAEYVNKSPYSEISSNTSDAASVDLQDLAAMSSSSGMYKLDFDTSVSSCERHEIQHNTDEMQLLQLQDTDLERFSNLSSASSELVLDDQKTDLDLEKVCVLSTDSGEDYNTKPTGRANIEIIAAEVYSEQVIEPIKNAFLSDHSTSRFKHNDSSDEMNSLLVYENEPLHHGSKQMTMQEMMKRSEHENDGHKSKDDEIDKESKARFVLNSYSSEPGDRKVRKEYSEEIPSSNYEESDNSELRKPNKSETNFDKRKDESYKFDDHGYANIDSVPMLEKETNAQSTVNEMDGQVFSPQEQTNEQIKSSFGEPLHLYDIEPFGGRVHSGSKSKGLTNSTTNLHLNEENNKDFGEIETDIDDVIESEFNTNTHTAGPSFVQSGENETRFEYADKLSSNTHTTGQSFVKTGDHEYGGRFALDVYEHEPGNRRFGQRIEPVNLTTNKTQETGHQNEHLNNIRVNELDKGCIGDSLTLSRKPADDGEQINQKTSFENPEYVNLTGPGGNFEFNGSEIDNVTQNSGREEAVSEELIEIQFNSISHKQDTDIQETETIIPSKSKVTDKHRMDECCPISSMQRIPNDTVDETDLDEVLEQDVDSKARPVEYANLKPNEYLRIKDKIKASDFELDLYDSEPGMRKFRSKSPVMHVASTADNDQDSYTDINHKNVSGPEVAVSFFKQKQHGAMEKNETDIDEVSELEGTEHYSENSSLTSIKVGKKPTNTREPETTFELNAYDSEPGTRRFGQQIPNENIPHTHDNDVNQAKDIETCIDDVSDNVVKNDNPEYVNIKNMRQEPHTAVVASSRTNPDDFELNKYDTELGMKKVMKLHSSTSTHPIESKHSGTKSLIDEALYVPHSENNIEIVAHQVQNDTSLTDEKPQYKEKRKLNDWKPDTHQTLKFEIDTYGSEPFGRKWGKDSTFENKQPGTKDDFKSKTKPEYDSNKTRGNLDFPQQTLNVTIEGTDKYVMDFFTKPKILEELEIQESPKRDSNFDIKYSQTSEQNEYGQNVNTDRKSQLGQMKESTPNPVSHSPDPVYKNVGYVSKEANKQADIEPPIVTSDFDRKFASTTDLSETHIKYTEPDPYLIIGAERQLEFPSDKNQAETSRPQHNVSKDKVFLCTDDDIEFNAAEFFKEPEKHIAPKSNTKSRYSALATVQSRILAGNLLNPKMTNKFKQEQTRDIVHNTDKFEEQTRSPGHKSGESISKSSEKNTSNTLTTVHKEFDTVSTTQIVHSKQLPVIPLSNVLRKLTASNDSLIKAQHRGRHKPLSVSNSSLDNVSDTSVESQTPRTKVRPGVIHMLNPCPSGWMEGGIKTKEKVEIKPPDHVPTIMETNLSALNFDVVDPEEKQNETLSHFPATDLLCKRVWKYPFKDISQNKDKAKTDGSGDDDNDKPDGLDKPSDFDKEINKGPSGDNKTNEIGDSSKATYSAPPTNKTLKTNNNESELSKAANVANFIMQLPENTPSLKSKYESLGLGNISIDDKELAAQDYDRHNIEFMDKDSSNSDDSEPTATDSSSGDEIELACFEMPNRQSDQNLNSSFDAYDNVPFMDDQVAIDCSVENVQMYKVDDYRGAGTLLPGTFYSGARNNIPEVIDETPYKTTRSNLKKRAKSDSSLERRVRFQENLPVYKSNQNLSSFSSQPTKKPQMFIDTTELEKIQKLEQFITCLFDNEPRKLGVKNELDERESQNNQTKASEIPDELKEIDRNIKDLEDMEEEAYSWKRKSDLGEGNNKTTDKKTAEYSYEIETDIDMPMEDGVTALNKDVKVSTSIILNPSLEPGYSGNSSNETKFSEPKEPFILLSGRCQTKQIVPLTDEHKFESSPADHTDVKTKTEFKPVPLVKHDEQDVETNGKGSHNYSNKTSESLKYSPTKGHPKAAHEVPVNSHIVTPMITASPKEVSRYTFSVNDSDEESPTIKTVTYEYVTEYKLNNVKIQYQKNCKTQTEDVLLKEAQEKYKPKYKPKTEVMSDNYDKPDTAIVVEQIIEKSVCYPLGPIYGVPSSHYERQKEYQEEIDKSVKTSPKKENSMDKSNVEPKLVKSVKQKDVNDKSKETVKEEPIQKSEVYGLQSARPRLSKGSRSLIFPNEKSHIFEHGSKKYIWRSFATNIPFDNVVVKHTDHIQDAEEVKTEKEKFNTDIVKSDSIQAKSDLTKTKVGSRSTDDKRPQLAKIPRIQINDEDENDVEDKYSKQNCESRARIAKPMVPRRKFGVATNVKFDGNGSERKESEQIENRENIEKNDQTDDSKVTIRQRESVVTKYIPMKDDVNDGCISGSEDEAIAAVMYERLPSVTVGEQTEERLLAVQALAVIGLGAVLLFLMPYV